MACSNALLAERSGSQGQQLEAITSALTAGSDDEESDEDAALVSKKTDEVLLGQFDIVHKVEMSEMANLFLGNRTPRSESGTKKTINKKI